MRGSTEDMIDIQSAAAENRRGKKKEERKKKKLHCEAKKGATLTIAITLSILDRFAKFFHCCKEQ